MTTAGNALKRPGVLVIGLKKIYAALVPEKDNDSRNKKRTRKTMRKRELSELRLLETGAIFFLKEDCHANAWL
jgi:hypothetical protein